MNLSLFAVEEALCDTSIEDARQMHLDFFQEYVAKENKAKCLNCQTGYYISTRKNMRYLTQNAHMLYAYGIPVFWCKHCNNLMIPSSSRAEIEAQTSMQQQEYRTKALQKSLKFKPYKEDTELPT